MSKNKIRRRTVSSKDLNKKSTIENNNIKKKTTGNNTDKVKKEAITLEEKLKREAKQKEQFELEREIYYRKKALKKKKRRELIKKVAPILLAVFIVFGVFAGGFTLYAIAGTPKVTKELVYDNFISSDVVESEEIPEDLKNAIVAMEDRRFYDHNGIDFKSLLRSVMNNLVTSSTQGGSTIDMQVSKNLITSEEKTFKRKVRDMYNAVCLNKIMEKDEILCIYLNNIYLGKSAYGVSKGAKVYFNKDVSELNLAQCAMLAGITNNPYRYSQHDQAKTRQIQVLDDMLEQGYITEEEYKEAEADPTVFASEID